MHKIFPGGMYHDYQNLHVSYIINSQCDNLNFGNI